jgi:N-acetylmuramoyl-L-alanine amidase
MARHDRRLRRYDGYALTHPRRLGPLVTLASVALAMVALAVAATAARQGASSRAALPFTVISPDGRRPLAATQAGDQVMVALDDVAALFQVAVREDALAGGVTVGYKGKTVILSAGQALASAGGRLVSLPAPPVRDGRRWLVPVEFISRALGVIYDSKLDVRKNARFVLVGDVRVPHVAVRPETLGPQTRVTFTVSPRTPYTVAQEPGRVLVKFDADALDIVLPASAPQGLVQSIRLADPSTTIAIDVGPRFGSFRTSLVPQDEGAQVLVDLMPATAEPAAAPAPPTRGGTPPLPVPPAPEAPLLQPAAGGLRTIVLDPGHGGDETGAKGSTGALEKDIVLSIARRLKASIETRLGVRVLLTRDGDQAIALDERAALANNNKADLFVSLHANASARREASGAQVYYLAADPAGEDARKVAATRQALPALGGGFREIEMVPWELAQLRHLGESALLAGAVEEQMRGRVRTSARPVQQAPFRLLAGANMPAVLVEIGFLTNPDEEQQLTSDAYQATVAQALLDGLLRFREAADQARTAPPPAPQPEPRRQP